MQKNTYTSASCTNRHVDTRSTRKSYAVTLLTVHSQDHLMTSIAFTDLAKEIIELYRRAYSE